MTTTHYVTDQALIDAEYRGRLGITSGRIGDTEVANQRRLYLAVYRNGDQRTFSVGHSDAAKVYAREYGQRILGGVGLISVRWQR